MQRKQFMLRAIKQDERRHCSYIASSAHESNAPLGMSLMSSIEGILHRMFLYNLRSVYILFNLFTITETVGCKKTRLAIATILLK